jgi:hypothetical protein
MELVRRMWESGLTTTAIAQICSTTGESIRVWLRKMKTGPQRGKKGPQRGSGRESGRESRRINGARDAKIKTMREAGSTLQHIGIVCGISKQRVEQILKRQPVTVSVQHPTALIHGPYQSPHVSLGDWVSCEIRGLVQVKTFTGAPIPQPIKRGQGCAIIVCGDLVRALRVESASAVAHWWGVSTHRVSIWRRALDIDRVTEGTRELLVANGNMDIGAQAHKGAQALRSDPAVYAKRNISHARSLRLRVETIGEPERQRLLGQFNGGRNG